MNHQRPDIKDIDLPIRRPASPEEVARVRREMPDPKAYQAWEEEQRLTTLLHRLSHRSVPPDFTRSVLRALDSRSRLSGLWQAWITAANQARTWTPRLASVAVVLALLLTTVWLQRQASERAQIAASVASITRPVQQAGRLTQLPPVDLLRDFEAIDQMRQFSSLADQELLAIFEQTEP